MPLTFTPTPSLPSPHTIRRTRTFLSSIRCASRSKGRSHRKRTRRVVTVLPLNDKWKRINVPNTYPPLTAVSLSQPANRPSNLRPDSCPALVLNADFSPLSYMPLSIWPWQDVVKAVFLDRVTVVATYDIGVRSPNAIFPLPSVISLKQYQPMNVRAPAFTRFNVFMRDNFCCQYCARRCPTHELTFDHVVPRCCNGKTNWTNVVTACVGCNHRKGRFLLNQLKGMRLRQMPYVPSHAQLQKHARNFPPQYLHHTWTDYVYWSQSMDEEAAE